MLVNPMSRTVAGILSLITASVRLIQLPELRGNFQILISLGGATKGQPTVVKN